MAYYQIDNKIYYLNLDNLFKMVIETTSNEKPVNTTITQSYGGEGDNGKEIVESKNNLNEVMNHIRYDMGKYLISQLFGNDFTMNGEPYNIVHLSDLSFAQGLCFNTLIEYKILSEIETNE